MIVVDANVIVALCVESAAAQIAETAAAKDNWCAPILWRSEFCSSMLKFIRSGIFTVDQAQSALQRANRILWGTSFTVRHEKALQYAAASKASTYDCEYVVLADDLGLKLVTLDEPLVKHFPRTAIHLYDYTSKP